MHYSQQRVFNVLIKICEGQRIIVILSIDYCDHTAWFQFAQSFSYAKGGLPLFNSYKQISLYFPLYLCVVFFVLGEWALPVSLKTKEQFVLLYLPCACVCVCVCACSVASVVSDSASLWTVAHQVPLYSILQARILEWVAVPSSRGSSGPRDGTCTSYVSCIGRQVLYHLHHLGSP